MILNILIKEVACGYILLHNRKSLKYDYGIVVNVMLYIVDRVGIKLFNFYGKKTA